MGWTCHFAGLPHLYPDRANLHLGHRRDVICINVLGPVPFWKWPLCHHKGVIYLNFFEQELRRIVGPVDPDATYVGRACFIQVSEQNRAKLQFTTLGIRDRYEALKLNVLNLKDGELDSTLLRFSEYFDCGGMGRSFSPAISDFDRGFAWYLHRPTARDYAALTEAVGAYLEVFQDMRQEQGQTMGQMMG